MAYQTIQELIVSKRLEISSTQAQIDSLKEKARDLRAELKGVEEAANLLSQVVTPQTVVGREGIPRSNGRRGRGLSSHWRAVLWEIAQLQNKTVRVKDVISICTIVGAPTAPNSVRSQLRQFLMRGYLTRVGKKGGGVYQLTNFGAHAAKKGKQQEAPGSQEPGAPSHNGDGSGSPSSSGSYGDGDLLTAPPGASPAQPRE